MASLARSITSSLRKRRRETILPKSPEDFDAPDDPADRIDEVTDNDEIHSPKRRRELDWPLRNEKPSSGDDTVVSLAHTQGKLSERQMFDSVRGSRFKEASMNDRPSEKPPSLFMRVSEDRNSLVQDMHVDNLMEEYMSDIIAAGTVRANGRGVDRNNHDYNSDIDGTGTIRANGRGADRNNLLGGYMSEIHGTGTIRANGRSADRHNLGGLTLHPNQSISSAAPTNGTAKGSVFRFGRSLASTFNPVNIWHNVVTTWKDTKEDLINDALDEQQKILREREAKAAATYAEMKRKGELGTPVSKNFQARERFTEENTPTPAEIDLQRGSRTQFDDYRSSVDRKRDGMVIVDLPADDPRLLFPSSIGALAAASPFPKTRVQASHPFGTPAPPKKKSFHFKTPSLTSLKKLKSDIQLVHPNHRHSTASMSPEKDSLAPVGCLDGGLHRSNSKKDLRKQQKLSKRVSDLETQLHDARRQLTRYSTDEPPLPPPPQAVLPAAPLTTMPTAPQRRAISPTPPLRRSASPNKRTFVPGTLPSLPSESLLPTERVGNHTIDHIEHERSRVERELETASGINFAPKADVGVPEISKPGETTLDVTTAVQTIEKDPSTEASPSQSSNITSRSQPTGIPANPKKSASKKPAKKRKSGGRDVYKPVAESDDGSEPLITTRTKNRTSPKNGSEDSGRASMPRVTKGPSSESANNENVNMARNEAITQAAIMNALAGSFMGDALATGKALPAAPTPSSPIGPVSADYGPPRSSMEGRVLETVVEETVVTTLHVALKDEPVKPTATKTPARPHMRVRSRSRSPEKHIGVAISETGFPEGRDSLQRRVSGNTRSRSPPPSSDFIDLVEEDEIVMVTPGRRDVPHMPGLPEGFATGKVEMGGLRQEEVEEMGDEEFEWPDDVF